MTGIVLLPKGLQVETLENELKIRYSWWSSKYLPAAGFGLIWTGILFIAILTGGSPSNFILCFSPHTWIGLGLLYYALTGFLNETTLTVTPDLLKIEHGPLPFFVRNKRFDPISLKQVYVKERLHHRKGTIPYSYEIHILTWDGRNEKLVGGLATSDQAFFLEQEIERFLAIKDKAVPGEFTGTAAYYYRGIKWDSWEKLAKANKLTFTQGKLLGNYRVFGSYQGCHLDLMVFEKEQNGRDVLYTRLIMTVDQSSQPRSKKSRGSRKQGFSSQKVAALFNPAKASAFLLKGNIQVEPGGQEISYEQPGLEAQVSYLQFLFETLHGMIEAYPKIVALGGEAVPVLQEIAAAEAHPARQVAAQLLQEIASTTLPLRSKISSLLCRRCLVHYGLHELKVPGLNPAVFYGCRTCGQSRDFYTVELVSAVLDRRMATTEVAQQDQTLRVNWLSRRLLFDFDQVEVIDASDEEVERFAVQVGNDTDPTRQSRYKDMGCRVAAACPLSQNSLRVLQQIFGQVTVIHE